MRIEFPGTDFPSQELPERACLPLHLNVQNSPLLFGCRSGLCGTCLIEVDDVDCVAVPPTDAEAEALEIYAPGNAKARLACQLVAIADLRIKKIRSA